MNETPEATRKSSGMPTGCVVAAVGCTVLFILGAIGVIYVIFNFKDFVTNVMQRALVDAVEKSQLSEEDKETIKQAIDRVAQDYKSGVIDTEDLVAILEEARPLVEIAIATGAVHQYVEPSGLSDEEKAEARTSLRRALRAAMDEQIPEDEMKELMSHVLVETGADQYEMKESLTDEELRDFVAAAKAKADELGIPLDIPEPDIAQEVQQAVDRAYESRR